MQHILDIGPVLKAAHAHVKERISRRSRIWGFRRLAHTKRRQTTPFNSANSWNHGTHRLHGKNPEGEKQFCHSSKLAYFVRSSIEFEFRVFRTTLLSASFFAPREDFLCVLGVLCGFLLGNTTTKSTKDTKELTSFLRVLYCQSVSSRLWLRLCRARCSVVPCIIRANATLNYRSAKRRSRCDCTRLRIRRTVRSEQPRRSAASRFVQS